MATTLVPRPVLVSHTKKSGIAVAADLLGYTRSTLQYEIYGDDRKCALNIVETVVRETVRCGQPEIAQRIQHRINMAAAEVLPVALTDELIELETELDAEEDKAEMAYVLNPSPASWDTYEKRLLKLRAVVDQVLAAGRVQWKGQH